MLTRTAVPIIDIAAAIDGSGIGAVAQEVDAACRDVGFFQIVGHGIDLELLDALYAGGDELWALPEAEKEPMRSPVDHPFHGWRPLRDSAGHALQERWQINRFDSADEARAHGIPEQYLDFFRENIWPEQVPALVDATKRYFPASQALGDRIMSIFAVALGLDEDHFVEALDRSGSYFGLNHYPGRSTEDPGTIALFEHSDSGTLTMLHQRGDYEGLEIALRSGDRFTVPIIDEAYVINIGDLMARWTNDEWVATRHRVVLGEPGEARTSITTFHDPRVDFVVEPLSTCIGDDGAHYEPISVYDWEPVFLDYNRD